MRKLLTLLTALLGMALSVLPSHAAVSQWAPAGGESDVQKEYSYQRMWWTDTSGFGGSGTYEHETIVYNAGFANPANGGYWSSNLPRAYKDTQFADTTENFTVGSAAASSIATYVWYYTYYDLQPQSSSVPTSSVRINAQRGHRWPSWCYSTWCVWADESYGLVVFTAPAGLSWVRR